MFSKKDLGNLIIAPIETYFLDNKTKELITNYGVCNFILFKKNIKDPIKLSKLINDIKILCKTQRLPTPLFAIDQEGGRVQRLAPPYWPSIPSNKDVGESEDPFTKIVEQASKIVNVLKSTNINLNLAPVLDLKTDITNEVLLERCYNSDEEKVSILGSMYIQIFNENRILCCAKHFPGIGSITKDPHKDIPLVNSNLKELKRHLLPFISAIKAKIPCIMTSHVIYQCLDENIATYSYRIATLLLKESLGFKGILITDDMEMEGTGEGKISQKALKAFMAGHDLILVCQSTENVKAILVDFYKEIENPSFNKRVCDALTRIKNIRSKFLV